MTPPPGLPIDPGLLERFRAAEAQISWREESPPRRARSGSRPPKKPAKPPARPVEQVRIAHLNDEDARVELRAIEGTTSMVVDSGPLGALVLLLEVERVGPPLLLTTHDASQESGFPQGSLEARWARGSRAHDFLLPLEDLIRLARYALA